MKKLIFHLEVPALGVLKKTALLLLTASVFATACKKSGEKSDATDGIEISEAGDDDSNMKNGASVSAPTGDATVAVYPVRAAHNTGYDSATQCAQSSWNCDRTYSNSDFIAGDHYGIDTWGALNAPIAAPVSGTVTFRGTDGGLGNTVVIREPSGWHHWLGHLNSIASTAPAVGAKVQAGTIIGYLGHTGSNSGGVNHLHYSVNHGSGYWSTGINFQSLQYARELAVCSTTMPVPAAPIANGKYKIVARHSGKAVVVQGASTANSAKVIQYDYTAGDNTNDEWTFTKIGTTGYYRITNVLSGKDLNVQSASNQNSAQIIQYDYSTALPNNDQWSIKDLGGGYYNITAQHTYKLLNVQGASTANSANVIQYGYTTASNAEFQIVAIP